MTLVELFGDVLLTSLYAVSVLFGLYLAVVSPGHKAALLFVVLMVAAIEVSRRV